MKGTFKLTALLGILGLAAWLGNSRPAYAYSDCNLVHGSFCSSPGTKTPCTLSDGSGNSTCTCTTGHTWRCLL